MISSFISDLVHFSTCRKRAQRTLTKGVVLVATSGPVKSEAAVVSDAAAIIEGISPLTWVVINRDSRGSALSKGEKTTCQEDQSYP